MMELKECVNLSFEEISEHLLKDERPSEYFNSISNEPEFRKYPLNLIIKLKDTEQSPKYHPEGNVWNHTMMVVDAAAAVRELSINPKAFMWAALLHDIGKPETTRNRKGKITSYDHDAVGAKKAEELLKYYTKEETFIRQVTSLVRYHMHMLYVLKDLPFGNMKDMLEHVNPDDIALLCRCDRFGRTGADLDEEESNYRTFLKRIKEYQNK